jgi:hypothetical protein
MKWMMPVIGAAMAVGSFACTQPPATADDETPPANVEVPAAEAPTFVNRVWSVAERSDGAAPGALYVFLTDGTLLISAPDATPALGRWRADGDGVVMVEEGIEYRVDILAVETDEFRIRSHNPGEPIEIRFERASDETEVR